MTTLITNNLRADFAEHFIEKVESGEYSYYLLASRHIPFTDDNNPPTPNNSVQETSYDVYEQSIFGKKVTSSDVNLMATKNIWTSGTVYAAYDDQDGDLHSKQYYVAVLNGSNYQVYKVLDNNGGIPSTVKPKSTLATAPSFTTSDGYVWKYMYSMSQSTFESFMTTTHIPVIASANVAGNTVSGALDIIKITSPGSNYVTTFTGTFNSNDVRDLIPISGSNTLTYRLATGASSNNDFYIGSALYITEGTGKGQIRKITDYDGSTRIATVNGSFTTPPVATTQYLIAPLITISGDGSDAVGYANVSSNSTVNNYLSKIHLVNRGTNYTYATAAVTGNTGNISNTATLRPILPPPGGHGKNNVVELGAHDLGFSIKFNTNESGYIPITNDFRKFILAESLLFDGVTFTLDTDTTDGAFTDGETVYQINRKTLIGTATSTVNSKTVNGISTEFSESLKQGDYVYILDSISNTSCIRTVTSVANDTQIVLSSAMPFTTSSAKIAYANVLARAIKTGNSHPYVTCTNTEPKFVPGKLLIGGSSGARGEVVSISVGEKSYNSWNTLDNRLRIRYNVYNGGMSNDAIVVQDNDATANARFHSSNGTFAFFTINKGVRAVENSKLSNGSSYFYLDNTSYGPDIVKNSGNVLYIENESPITRSSTTSETFKLVIQL